MLNKNDPLIQSVQKVMEENNVRREAEKAVNEELGIFNKKALPFELHKLYDSLLEEVIQEALNEKLVGNQHKIDVNKNNRVDAHDFKLLRSKKKEKKPEEHGVEAEREMASKGEKMYEANKENKEKKNAAVEKIGMERIKKTGAFHGQSPKRTGRAALAKEEKIEEKRGLWDNIHAKRKRIAAGSGEKMRKPGSEGAPTEKDLKAAQNESAPPGAKYERMVKHIKKGYSKGGLTDKEKSIAYATAWKAKNKAKD